MIHSKYIIYHDLIGFKAKVRLKSKKKSLEFRDIGIIIDETKNLIITDKDNQIKKYIKKDHVFRLMLDEEVLEIDGSKLVGTPENRLRSLKKKRIVGK